jgi:adenylate cyclase
LMVGVSETVFNLIGGSDVSGHYFFLAAPAIIVMVVGPKQWPIGALIVIYFLALFLFSEHFLPERGTLANLSDGLALGSFAFCVIMSGILNFMVALYAFSRLHNAEEALAVENERSENLLLNLVPASIANRLKASPSEVIADYLPSATIMFADIVDFTPFAARLSADEVVVFLNRVFSEFDALCEKHGLEKIKTIGDAYMVAGGVPEQMPNSAQAVADMALDMLAESDRISAEFDMQFALRIGIHSGPVVAGVIGTRKLFYDLWGDAVNIAARMESHGRAGRIQVSLEAKDAIGDGYVFEDGGSRNIKGKGHTQVYFLTGKIRADEK